MIQFYETFRRDGYVHLRGAYIGASRSRLQSECAALLERASRLLVAANYDPLQLARLYSERCDEPIVVPEVDHPAQVCRVEYLAGCSEYFRVDVATRLAGLILQELSQNVVLFKDKCNVKLPQGGGYTPHQDVTAYRHFGPQFHITAAIMIDPATAANGCLEMAPNYLSQVPMTETVNTPFGRLPLLPSYVGGPRNGDILEEIAKTLDWQVLEAEPGDVILFDSFVPHRSKPNRSHGSRRVLFFTFNLTEDGSHYEAYYRAKRGDPGNPMFHVSTPTVHSQREVRPVV